MVSSGFERFDTGGASPVAAPFTLIGGLRQIASTTYTDGGFAYEIPNSRANVIKDITGSVALGNTKTTIHQVTIDARLNPGEDVYTRIWLGDFSSTAVAIGSTAAHIVVPMRAGLMRTWLCNRGTENLTAGDGIYVATVTTPGGTGGGGHPSGQVIVRIVATTA